MKTIPLALAAFALTAPCAALAGPYAALFCKSSTTDDALVAFDIAPDTTSSIISISGKTETPSGVKRFQVLRSNAQVQTTVEYADADSAILTLKTSDGAPALIPTVTEPASTEQLGSIKRFIIQKLSGNTQSNVRVSVSLEFVGGNIGVAHYTNCSLTGGRTDDWNALFGIGQR